jgi:Mn2+/Fe2+ NRAMP family transporter
VVVLSNLIAIMLQTLAARLGLVTGKHLAQVGMHTGIQQMQKLPSSSRIAAQALLHCFLQHWACPQTAHTWPVLLQVCREAYPPAVCYMLWVMCEISIVALDVTMVLGELS